MQPQDRSLRAGAFAALAFKPNGIETTKVAVIFSIARSPAGFYSAWSGAAV